MDAARVAEARTALEALAAADVATADRHGLDVVLGHLGRLRAVVAGFDVEVARRARELAADGRSECAEGVLGERGRRDARDARAAAERERACATVGGFEDALWTGTVTAGHVDALAAATNRLDDDVRSAIAGRADDLLEAAAAQSVGEFASTCADLVRELQADDGTSRLEQQRRQRRVSRWTDRESGMWNLRLQLDPLTGAKVDSALDSVTRTARAAAIRGEAFNFDHAAADCLVELITGARSVDPRVPEVAVHVDVRTLVDGVHEHSLCELADGTPIPLSIVRRLCCEAEILPVVLGATGEVLDIGRSRRLANRAQRRALRAMYRTCAHPGCTVPFDRCEIHHVLPWETLGRTDLANLVPLCSAHHHLVHEGGWTLALDPDRQLTLTRPDGEVVAKDWTNDRSHRHAERATSVDRSGRRARPADEPEPASGRSPPDH